MSVEEGLAAVPAQQQFVEFMCQPQLNDGAPCLLLTFVGPSAVQEWVLPLEFAAAIWARMASSINSLKLLESMTWRVSHIGGRHVESSGNPLDLLNEACIAFDATPDDLTLECKGIESREDLSV
jgi:hypothetical protein